jgi:putative flavoprotein involved in K+ transport
VDRFKQSKRVKERAAMSQAEHFDTIVIGGGQAGLATGYYLKQQGRDFVILDANTRIGDSWRHRWDSLRLFTPARFDGLVGMPFPAQGYSLPAKDEMADYLEAYAAHFQLPVRTGVKVDRLAREDERFVVTAGDQRFEADNVVVAMATFQQPKIPMFAAELDPDIVQLHSSAYRNPSQLREGGVLIVGAGNSGAEIALEVVRTHPIWLAGRDVGHIPFRVEGGAAQLLIRPLFRVVFHRVLSTATPIGRRARPKFMSGALPLIRVKPKDLIAAGVVRVPKIAGVQDGQPRLQDGRTLDVANVIWATGYTPGFSWIDLPVFGEREPLHTRGVVTSEPGLYFIGLDFLYAVSSAMIHGVSRDAEYIARHIASRSETSTPAVSQSPSGANSYASR